MLKFLRKINSGSKEMNEDIKKALDYFQKMEYEKALEIFEKLLQEEENAGLLNNIGTCYFKLGNLDKALEFYQRGLKADRELKQLYKNISDIYVEKGDVMSAIGILQDAVSAMPDEDYLRYALAKLYIKDCHQDIAVDELQKILDHNPDNLEAKYELAKIYYDEGSYEEAAEYYESISEKLENADIFFWLGESYAAAGNLDKAIFAYLRSISKNEMYYPSYKKLGLCYMAQDDKVSAAEFFEDYLKFDTPDVKEREEIEKILEKLKA